MSALGRHRDSVLGLSNLALHHVDDHSHDNTCDSEEKYDAGFDFGENDVMLGITMDNDDDLFVPFPTKTDDGDGLIVGFPTQSEDDSIHLHMTPSPVEHEQHSSKTGILKTSGTKEVKPYTGNDKQQAGRRAIFSSLTNTSSQIAHTKKKVTFSPTKRVVVMPSLCSMKSEIWWDSYDYVCFRRTAVFLANSLPSDGAETWLHVNSESKSSASGLLTSDHDAGGGFPEEKWWCKFGHSRRGLEHICCEKEGNIRHQKVTQAIHAVLHEQERKTKVGRVSDAQSLARISCKHTRWARDLALAAGFADAKAVATDFDEKLKIHRDNYIETARVATASESSIGNVMVSFRSNCQRKLFETISASLFNVS